MVSTRSKVAKDLATAKRKRKPPRTPRKQLATPAAEPSPPGVPSAGGAQQARIFLKPRAGPPSSAASARATETCPGLFRTSSRLPAPPIGVLMLLTTCHE